MLHSVYPLILTYADQTISGQLTPAIWSSSEVRISNDSLCVSLYHFVQAGGVTDGPDLLTAPPAYNPFCLLLPLVT